jgi:hypothetical protein
LDLVSLRLTLHFLPLREIEGASSNFSQRREEVPEGAKAQ